VPLPYVAVGIAVIMELGVGIALILGFLTRPLSLLLALYTLATATIGHHFWTMSGMERVEAEINFFKNVSIMAGLLLLYLTGPGRYSLDSKIKLSRQIVLRRATHPPPAALRCSRSRSLATSAA
jgi:putative oxidoreductase